MKDRQRRAELAKQTLNNSFISDAIDAITQACHSVIEDSAHDQVELREDMYYMTRSVKAFKGILHKYIQDGKVEDINQLNIKRIKR